MSITITQNETKEIELMIAPGTKASYQVTVDDKVVLFRISKLSRISNWKFSKGALLCLKEKL